MPNRRPAKINHKRRYTEAEKKKHKREAREARERGPFAEIDLGNGRSLRMRLENADVNYVKTDNSPEAYGYVEPLDPKAARGRFKAIDDDPYR